MLGGEDQVTRKKFTAGNEREGVLRRSLSSDKRSSGANSADQWRASSRLALFKLRVTTVSWASDVTRSRVTYPRVRSGAFDPTRHSEGNKGHRRK